MITEIDRIDDVRGWPLAIVKGENRPRVGHREVARRLGYADAKKLLELGERVFGAAWKLSLPWAEFRSGGRGPLARDYLLSKSEIIRLTMRSDAVNAELMQVEFADVIEAWLDGRLRADLTAARHSAQVATSDAFLALGARVADNTIARADLASKIRLYSKAAGVSRQKAEGRVRKEFGVVSYLRMPMATYPIASLHLVQWAEEPSAPPQLSAGRASSQLNLFERVLGRAA